MTITTKVEPIARDIEIIINETLSPAARSAAFASFARDMLKEGEEINRSVLGRIPRHKTFVDGSEGAKEDAVRPDGVIVYEFELLNDLFLWIADQLRRHAPVKTGKFRDSFTFYADGSEVDVGSQIPDASEYTFINIQPYARKIERGESPQAPEGVFQVVATMARARFGNLAKIGFVYRSPIGGVFQGGRVGNRSGTRTPAISITVK
jgi:hypothetical protein